MKDTREVRQLFDKLCDTRVNPGRFTRNLQSVAFELIDADTFIAGIASCLLDSEAVNASHASILRSPFLEGTFWLSRDGCRTDLHPYPELLEYAQRVEALRRACAVSL